MLHTDAMVASSMRSKPIEKSDENLKLFRSYEEYIDKLISQALLNGIEARCVLFAILTILVNNLRRFASIMFYGSFKSSIE